MMLGDTAIRSPPDDDRNQKVNSLHFDMGVGHNTVLETDSIEGSVILDDIHGSPGLPRGGIRSGGGGNNSQRNFDETLKAQDVMAMSALISTLQSTIDDFVGNVKEFCQRHAIPFKKETIQMSMSGSGQSRGRSQAAVKVGGESPAASHDQSIEVVALQSSIKSEVRFSKNEALLDLASHVDSFFARSAALRETSRRVTQRLTNRHVTTQSFAHIGNSRFTATYLNLAAAANANSSSPSALQSGFSSPARMSMIGKPRIPQGPNKAFNSDTLSAQSASPGLGPLVPRASMNMNARGKLVSVLSPTSQRDPLHQGESDFFPAAGSAGVSMEIEISPKKEASQTIVPMMPLRHCNESMISFQSLTGSVAGGHQPHAMETTILDVTRDTEGNKLINEYLVIGELGRGSFGKVKLAEHKQHRDLVAIKILNKSMLRKVRNGMTSAIQQVQTEIAVMKKLRHRNIVNLYEVIDDPKSNKMYLVMQYVANGTVRSINTDGTCPKLEDKLARDYARQLAAGLNYLHRHNVVHRDIKPDNILLGANGNIYLSDFGVSEILDEDTDFIVGSQGTPAFMSPELCRGEGSVHGKAVDMWALGVTLYTFVVGKLPFYGKNFDEISQKVQNNALELPSDLDEEWVELLSSLLNKDPKRRMTASELRQSPLLFGKGDAMAQSRRASAIDVVFVDDEDIENAIAVGNQVYLCCHRTPREKLHEYVEAIQKRVAANKAKREDEERRASINDNKSNLFVHVQLSVDGAADDSSPLNSWAPLSPHPPSSITTAVGVDDQLSVKSPPQRPITREGSLHQPSPPTTGRLGSGGNMLAVPDFDSPRNGAATGAKLRAASITSPDKALVRASLKASDT